MSKEKKKGGCGSFLWFIIILGLIGSIFSDDDDTAVKKDENSQVQQNIEKSLAQTKVVEKNTETFVDNLSEYVDKTVAEEVYDIYLNQIGFSELKFIRRVGETDNYKIEADSWETLAIINEEGIRINIPNTEYLFYENGELILTLAEIKDKYISDLDMVDYYAIAKMIIENNLKSPASAKFPSSSEISYQKKENLVAIKGYVDAQNSFGAMLRSDYIVQFYVTDLENAQYELVYIQIDGKSSGTFIEYE